MPHRLVKSIPARTLILLAVVCITFAGSSSIQAQKPAQKQFQKQAEKVMTGRTVRLLTRDGKVLEGRLSAGGFRVNGVSARSVGGQALLSINLAADASPREAERITAGLVAIQGADRAVHVAKD